MNEQQQLKQRVAYMFAGPHLGCVHHAAKRKGPREMDSGWFLE